MPLILTSQVLFSKAQSLAFEMYTKKLVYPLLLMLFTNDTIQK